MPLCSNYGGILQNYALQQILIQLGHQPITLRIPTGYQGLSKREFCFRSAPVSIIKFFIKRILGRPSTFPESYSRWIERVSGMEKFIKKNIETTAFIRDLSYELIKDYHLDMLIVGSDQIWRPGVNNVLHNYFCGFAKGSSVKRISYAASFALDKWPFNSKVTQEAEILINEFQAVSVRENNAVEFCRQYLHVDAQWVLDPTFLLEKEHYMRLCMNIPISKNKIIVAYLLDQDEDKIKMTEFVAKKMECKVLFMSADSVKKEDSVEKWLACFRDAEYVITDSFHGTVFSIIFNKNFYCFNNPQRGNARMESLKQLTGLHSRFIHKSVLKLEDKIDYASVSSRIAEMKEISLKFLKKNISFN